MTYNMMLSFIEGCCKRLALLQLVFLFALYLFGTAAFGQDAATIFKDKCAGCHSIGGGDLVGPDLARSKYADIDDLKADVKRMETNTGPLTDKEVDALVDFLKNASPSKAPSTEVKSAQAAADEKQQGAAGTQKPVGALPVSIDSPAQAEPASAQRGRSLLFGDEALKNGGLSCIACHSIDGSGGNMGPDLTGIAAKMPPVALVSACEHTPYKVMKAAYKDHVILHQEALDLGAYLSSLKEPHEKTGKLPVALLGGGLAAAILALIAIGYRGTSKSAREKLQRRD